MKHLIATHKKAIRAEWQKLRHSGMFWLCTGAALFIPLLIISVGLFGQMSNNGSESWNKLIEMNFQVFTSTFFPLFLVIMMVRLVFLEHQSDTWKLIETQPVSKAAIFLAKWETGAAISFLCLLAMFVFLLLGGMLLQFAKPSLGLQDASINWGRVLQAIVRYWVASLCIISIQYFFSLLIKSFAWPMMIGVIGIVAGAIAGELGYLNWWPYTATQFTSRNYGGSVTNQFFLSHEKISVLTSVLFLLLGYQLYKGKSFRNAFVRYPGKAILAVSLIAIFAAMIWFVNKPVTLSRYTSTVVAGKFETDADISYVSLLRPPLMDTILHVPVVNRQFHAATDKLVAPGIYILKAGIHSAQVFMGKNDSTYFDLSTKGQFAVKVSGTRIAENEYLKKGQGNNMEYLKPYMINEKPHEVQRMLMETYGEGVHNLEVFKTTDRIKPAEDFMQARRKLFKMQALTILDGYYTKLYKAYFPNEELIWPAGFNELRTDVSMNAPELITFPDYRKYVTTILKVKSRNNDSIYFRLIRDSIKDAYARDMMLYEASAESLSKIRDSASRSSFVQMLTKDMQTEKVKSKILEMNERANKVSGVSAAFDIEGETMSGQKLKLSDLRGKYIVIEFRSTDCMGCKNESAYFDVVAAKFTSLEVAFLSVKMDGDKKQWLEEIKPRKDSKVLQLHSAISRAELIKAFGISSLPKFVLIDPSGMLVSSTLPLPSNPEFELILEKEFRELQR